MVLKAHSISKYVPNSKRVIAKLKFLYYRIVGNICGKGPAGNHLRGR